MVWAKFLSYAILWAIGAAVWWSLFPVRMIQVEFGSLADWATKRMKEVAREWK